MPNTPQGHENRITRLEKKDEHYEERFNRIHKKIDENERKAKEDSEKLFKSLDDIKQGQHSQELINQKMDFTLETINRDRERETEYKREERERQEREDKERRMDVKKVKYWSLGLIGTVITSLVIAALRMWLGI